MHYPHPESSTLEFKRSLPQNDQIIRTIIGFCNQFGGKLVIGVDDSGAIVGTDGEPIESVMEYLEKSIYESCAPPILPLVYQRRFEDQTVLVIQVSSGMNKPYYRLSEGMEKGTYIRLGRSTVRANADMIEELRWRSRGRFFDGLPVYHATRLDLSDNAIEEFIRKRKIGKKVPINDEILQSYPLLIEEHGKIYPTTAGILLFGKQPQRYFPEAMIICSRFKGTEGRKALASMDCEGTLIQQFNQALDFVLRHLESSFEVSGIRRTQKLEIPEEAIREVLLNLVAHRNYHLLAPAKVAIYDDRIEVFSPGTFPGPLDTQNLLEGISYLRNPAIGKVLRESGYIEKLGSGFIALYESYLRSKLAPPVVIEGENFVKCVLPRRMSIQMEDTDELNELQQIEQLTIQMGMVTVHEVMTHLKVSRSTAQRRLTELVTSKRLIRKGAGRSVHYVRKN